MAQLLSYDNLLNYPVWIDFSTFAKEKLEITLDVAEKIVLEYLEKSFWDGPFTEEGQAVIDHKGRVFISLKGRNIDQLISMKFFVDKFVEIVAIDDRIDLYKKAGYLYYSTYYASSQANYPSRILSSVWNVRYEIEYTCVNNDAPWEVKYAIAMVAANMMKAQSNFENTWMVWVNSDPTGFTSWGYSVEFWGKSKGFGSGSDDQLANSFLTPDVTALIRHLKRRGQNKF